MRSALHKSYSLVELLELIDDLEKIQVIQSLSKKEKDVVSALERATDSYNELTESQLIAITKIPKRTIIRILKRLELLKIIFTYRDVCKFVSLNPVFLEKKDLYRAIRLNAIRLHRVEGALADVR